MRKITQNIINYLQKENYNYDFEEGSDDKGDMIILTYDLDNLRNIKIHTLVMNSMLSFSVWNFVEVPKHKVDIILREINALNLDCPWVKFDYEEGYVSVTADLLLNMDYITNNIGEIWERCNYELLSAADESYPEIMKAIWS